MFYWKLSVSTSSFSFFFFFFWGIRYHRMFKLIIRVCLLCPAERYLSKKLFQELDPKQGLGAMSGGQVLGLIAADSLLQLPC